MFRSDISKLWWMECPPPFGRNFTIAMGTYRPELSEYFKMYQYQLNFAMFCATSALGISWQHLNHPDLLVPSVDSFHVYFHALIILHHLGIPLSQGDGFSWNPYIKSAYYNTCDYCGVNVSEMWMSWNWFYIADGEKVTQSSAVDNLIRLMIIQSKDFTSRHTSLWFLLLRLKQGRV